MKKKIAIIIALCVVLAAAAGVFAACGDDENTGAPRYEYFTFAYDESLGGLILDVSYYSLLPDGELTLPEESAYYTTVDSVDEETEREPKPVVAIADRAFEGNTRLTKLTVPACVRSIGERAFYECGALTSVAFGDGAEVAIGGEAFKYCASLKTVSGGRATEIGEEAFFGCTSLSEFATDASGAEMGDGAFGSCISLDKVPGAA